MTGRRKEQRQEETIKECKDSSRNKGLERKDCLKEKNDSNRDFNKYLEIECGEDRREMMCV